MRVYYNGLFWEYRGTKDELTRLANSNSLLCVDLYQGDKKVTAFTKNVWPSEPIKPLDEQQTSR